MRMSKWIVITINLIVLALCPSALWGVQAKVIVTKPPTPNPSAPEEMVRALVRLQVYDSEGHVEAIPPGEHDYEWYINRQTLYHYPEVDPEWWTHIGISHLNEPHAEVISHWPETGEYKAEAWCSVPSELYGFTGNYYMDSRMDYDVRAQDIINISAVDANNANRKATTNGKLQMAYGSTSAFDHVALYRDATLKAEKRYDWGWSAGDPRWSGSENLSGEPDGRDTAVWSASETCSDTVRASAGTTSKDVTVELVPNGSHRHTIVFADELREFTDALGTLIHALGGPDLDFDGEANIVVDTELVDTYAVPTVSTAWKAAGGGDISVTLAEIPFTPQIPILSEFVTLGGYIDLEAGAGVHITKLCYDPSKAPGESSSTEVEVNGAVSGTARFTVGVDVSKFVVEGSAGLTIAGELTGTLVAAEKKIDWEASVGDVTGWGSIRVRWIDSMELEWTLSEQLFEGFSVDGTIVLG